MHLRENVWEPAVTKADERSALLRDEIDLDQRRAWRQQAEVRVPIQRAIIAGSTKKSNTASGAAAMKISRQITFCVSLIAFVFSARRPRLTP